MTIGAGEIPKSHFSIYTEKYTENTEKSDKTLSIRLQIISNLPYNPIGSAFDRYRKPTVDLHDLWSNDQYVILGGLRVQRLPAQKGGFPLSFASHVSTSVWDWAEPAAAWGPPEIRLYETQNVSNWA